MNSYTRAGKSAKQNPHPNGEHPALPNPATGNVNYIRGPEESYT